MKVDLRFLKGFALGLSLACITIFWINPSQAKPETPKLIEVIHNISMQNYYLIQKTITYQAFHADLSLKIADRSKVKNEDIIPLTNNLQKELFKIDIKLKELNR